jgi:hypothetical protein
MKLDRGEGEQQREATGVSRSTKEGVQWDEEICHPDAVGNPRHNPSGLEKSSQKTSAWGVVEATVAPILSAAMSARPRSLNLLFSMFAAVAACSTSDTTLALTVNSGADIGAVDHLHVVVTPASGSPFVFDFKPPTTDGAIVASFFERIKLPSGFRGPATVTVEAQSAAGTTTAAAVTTTDIVENGAVAASVTLKPGGLPVGGGDGGTDGGADAAGADAVGDADASSADGSADMSSAAADASGG